jgi:hypothetical protein
MQANYLIHRRMYCMLRPCLPETVSSVSNMAISTEPVSADQFQFILLMTRLLDIPDIKG